MISVLVMVLSSCEGFREPRADPGPDCWFNYVCDSEGNNKLDEIRNDIPTAQECYDLCNANADCKFFTFRELYMGQTVCTLLTTCNLQTTCSNPASCTSGPNDCTVVNPCPQLTYTAGSAIWSCDGLVDPYQNQIPDGYTCHTSCGGWKSLDGTETVMASATCVNGAWDNLMLQPDTDAVVNTPDTDSPCQCMEFQLWYNPNDEPGADFYCTQTDFSAASAENILSIQPDEECVLLCDNFLVANIQCQNGDWTDADPETGIACYKAPPTLPGPPASSTAPAPTGAW